MPKRTRKETKPDVHQLAHLRDYEHRRRLNGWLRSTQNAPVVLRRKKPVTSQTLSFITARSHRNGCWRHNAAGTMDLVQALKA
jgi:hypothetical protein